MPPIPTLETERLRLRPHRSEDLEACAAMWGDPVVTKYIGGRPLTREEVWARMLRYAGHWVWMGFGFWVIEDRESGRFLGEIGLADFKRDLSPPLAFGPEAGWILVQEAHGHGFATEALRAVTAWAEIRCRARTLCCLIQPANNASVRVANKCGFQEARRVLYQGHASVLLIRTLTD